MSFSSGTFTLVAGNPVVTATTISSTWANNTLSDIATGLSTCILKDGTQTTTASVPFAVGIDVTTGATTTSTTFACFNTNATTVNAFGAASSALNIGHASAPATFAGGVSVPTGKTYAGAATISISGTGPHAIGGATSVSNRLRLTGTYAGTTTGVIIGVEVDGTLNPSANDQAYGAFFGGTAALTMNIAGSGTHSDFASLAVAPPTVGAGVGTLTNATTLKITAAPTGGTNNRAFWIVAGKVTINGLPTSSAGLNSGDIWANSNVLTVVP